MTNIEGQYEAAIAVSRHALEQFNAEPLVASTRGGPRLSPWWRVWVQASEVAPRWHRHLERGKTEHVGPWPYDTELDRLLGTDRVGIGEGWRPPQFANEEDQPRKTALSIRTPVGDVSVIA